MTLKNFEKVSYHGVLRCPCTQWMEPLTPNPKVTAASADGAASHQAFFQVRELPRNLEKQLQKFVIFFFFLCLYVDIKIFPSSHKALSGRHTDHKE